MARPDSPLPAPPAPTNTEAYTQLNPCPQLSSLGCSSQRWQIGPAMPLSLTLIKGFVFRLLSPEACPLGPNGHQSHTRGLHLLHRRRPCHLELRKTFRSAEICHDHLRTSTTEAAPWTQTRNLTVSLTHAIKSAPPGRSSQHWSIRPAISLGPNAPSRLGFSPQA